MKESGNSFWEKVFVYIHPVITFSYPTLPTNTLTFVISLHDNKMVNWINIECSKTWTTSSITSTPALFTFFPSCCGNLLWNTNIWPQTVTLTLTMTDWSFPLTREELHRKEPVTVSISGEEPGVEIFPLSFGKNEYASPLTVRSHIEWWLGWPLIRTVIKSYSCSICK